MTITESVQKFVCHGRPLQRIAKQYGWLPGARYTNLRDVRGCARVGFLDIDWRNYNFKRHLAAAKATHPMFTVARDIIRASDVCRICDEASELGYFADRVIVVPKALELGDCIEDVIPK